MCHVSKLLYRDHFDGIYSMEHNFAGENIDCKQIAKALNARLKRLGFVCTP